MDKNQVIEILSSKGFAAHDTNGILYIDLDNIGPASINKVRTMLKELHYHNSWGVKMIQGAVLPAFNKASDIIQDFNYSKEERENTDDEVYFKNTELEYTSEESENLDRKNFDRENFDRENLDRENLEKDNSEIAQDDDDMMFDINSPFEQVSLFDMMS